MSWQYAPYPIVLLLAGAALLFLAAYAWRRRGVPGATALALLTAAAAWWAAAYGLSLGAVETTTKFFWGDVKYLGIVAVPPAWLAFALAYTGRGDRLTRRNLALLSAFSLATLAAVFTNDWHGFFWGSRGLGAPGPFPTAEPVYGPWFWANLAYSYALVLLGTALLFRALFSARLYRGQRAALLVGVCVPWAGNALNVFGLLPAGLPDPAPFAFAVSGAAFAWGLSRRGLLDVVPVARDAVFGGMGDGVVVLDIRGRVVDLNPAAERALGRSASETAGMGADRVLPDGAVRFLQDQDGANEARGEARIGTGAGARDHEIVLSPLRDRGGGLAGRLVVLRDVTERRRAEEALKASEARLRAITEGTAVGVALVDLSSGRLVSSNPALRAMLGYGEEELRTMGPADLTHPNDLGTAETPYEGLLDGERDHYRTEKRYLRKDGRVLWVRLTASLVREGDARFLVLVVEDGTERKALEEQLERQALHDPLTDLPNRRLFFDRLEHALARAFSRGRPAGGPGGGVAVLFLDLDGLKAVNDSLGHEVGDRLLVETAWRLSDCVRPGDTVARLGGDEFAVLLEDVAGEEAQEAALRVGEALRVPVVLAGLEVSVSASVGAALADPSADPTGVRPADLLREADAAMYEAKREGKARRGDSDEAGTRAP